MRKVERAYEITDAKIQFVSLVDRAANKRPFLLKKADDGKAAFTTYGRIVKADADSHYVTGIVYEPMEEDSHGNFMTEEEITKAAYWFAKNGDKVDLQHSFEPLDGAVVVENWIAKADFEIDGEAVKKGTWLMTVEVADESTWEDIEKGNITGFSMGGLGNYSEEDVNLDNMSKQENSEKKGLLKQLAKALGLNVVEKGQTAELYAERSRGQLFWEAFYALKDTLYQYSPYEDKWIYETDEDKVRECLEDFNQIVTTLLTGKESITKALQARPVEKAGKKLSGKNKETLQGIYDSLGTFLAEFDDKKDEPEKIDPEDSSTGKEKKEDEEVIKQDVEQLIEKSVAAAIAKATKDADAKEDDDKDAAAKDTDGKEKDKKEEEVDEETVTKMVEAAITKALELPAQEQVTADQVADMVVKAVEKVVEPVLRSRGLPNNLNGDSVEKNAGEHYLHGIL